ncbi:MAG: hypothetical protein BWX48_02675 [Verrucomicrobia bacterium ADurb.Bin006]|jgi:hypothetical protein|nr:MAG: hypothetical protein BWX48_02675 [Verrucomicrobia bacterium ADurb.Bin006]
MTPRERIAAALDHRETAELPADFRGRFQTGIAVGLVYQLRQGQEWYVSTVEDADALLRRAECARLFHLNS